MPLILSYSILSNGNSFYSDEAFGTIECSMYVYVSSSRIQHQFE